ncbi:MAG: DUF1643 domain-containing protein [Oscillatoriophycideae cyanobacterium NC_groundwater_1537_Pr4_S-0.65um_50_18]|nr:DUF1643 domain-containing protein [Oscillatoriophycideae cyanobacterium NC_groundwater_1537_Pr4_S-0.65um_50_18]
MKVRCEEKKQGAIFDRTKTYRYSLWRSWDDDKPRVAFVMLNPSTADADCNDPTLRRCIGFAQTWGYGSLVVVNLFALRATHPEQLRQVRDPIGQECDRYILAAVSIADCTVVAWGNGGHLKGRDRTVQELIGAAHCLGVNRSGQPRHPLYARSDSPLMPFNAV